MLTLGRKTADESLGLCLKKGGEIERVIKKILTEKQRRVLVEEARHRKERGEERQTELLGRGISGLKQKGEDTHTHTHAQSEKERRTRLRGQKKTNEASPEGHQIEHSFR